MIAAAMERTEQLERSGAALRHSWQLWAGIFVGWTLIGLTFTFNYYYFADHYVAIFTKQPSLREMVVWELPYWLLWAALTPVVVWLTERFPLERGRRVRNFSLHVAACLVLLLVHRAAYLLLGWLLHVAVYRRLASLPVVYSFLFFFNLSTGFMSYGVLVLVSYAIAYYRRARQEQLIIARPET